MLSKCARLESMCGRYVNKLTGESIFSFFEVNDNRIE